MHGLAVALLWAALLGHLERGPAEVERAASELVELSTRQGFAFWLATALVLLGWSRGVSGNSGASISWMEDGIEDLRSPGSMLCVRFF